jgi:hypothetical protein
MADKKISALPALSGTDLSTGDLLHVIDTSGTYTNKNLTIGNMFQNIPTWIGLSGTTQTLTTTPSDVNVSSSITQLNSSGGTDPYAHGLADGTQGQIKIITMITAGNNAVVSPTSASGYSSITFDAVGESVVLLFTNSAWSIISVNGATVA